MYNPHPEFARLYKLYTGDPDSMGHHLTERMAELSQDDPLLVITGSDAVLFPGAARSPVAESFRKSTRGFVELAAVSHLGTAVAWLVRLRELDDPIWRTDAERLIEQIDRTRRVNTVEHWRTQVVVPALAGRESKIVDMVDYCCAVTRAFVAAGLTDESLMRFERLRERYLEPSGRLDVPVPINDVMVATFALAFLDIGHRIIRWLQASVLDWSRLMVMLSGQSGRPTAGLTWASNNMCHLIWKASAERLPPERLYIAPHAPSLILAEVTGEDRMRELEKQFRAIWSNTRASVELARSMFEGFPAFQPVAPRMEAGSATGPVSEMPQLESWEDRFAAVSRLRFVMEDPGQLLANSVASYVVDQLCACGNSPAAVRIPGFDNIEYPPKPAGSYI